MTEYNKKRLSCESLFLLYTAQDSNLEPID
jgi:hypothetical protein